MDLRKEKTSCVREHLKAANLVCKKRKGQVVGDTFPESEDDLIELLRERGLLEGVERVGVPLSNQIYRGEKVERYSVGKGDVNIFDVYGEDKLQVRFVDVLGGYKDIGFLGFLQVRDCDQDTRCSCFVHLGSDLVIFAHDISI